MRVPVAVGANWMLTPQLDGPARVLPQVFAVTAKSLALGPEIAMPVRLMAPGPGLLKVTVWAELLAPTAVFGNERVAGVTLASRAFTVPDNATVWGLFPAESLNVNVAVRVPAAAGRNVMLTVQLPEPARFAPHVFAAMEKSPDAGPEMMMLLMLITVAPPLLRVTVCGGLVDATIGAAKTRLAGDTVALGRLPVPDSNTVCGLLVALSVKLRVAARVPAAEGVNTTSMVQLAEAARALPHMLAEMAKSPALVPAIAAPAMEMTASPRFCKVMICAGLLVPGLNAPNATEAGLAAAEPMGITPIPERDTEVGALLVLSVNRSVACRAPATVGTKSNVAVQLTPAARMAPQVWLRMEKSPGFAPERVMLRMAMARVPAFVRVTSRELPVEPMSTLCQEMLLGFTKIAKTETQLVSGSRHRATRNDPAMKRVEYLLRRAVSAGTDLKPIRAERKAMRDGITSPRQGCRCTDARRQQLRILSILEGMLAFRQVRMWIDLCAFSDEYGCAEPACVPRFATKPPYTLLKMGPRRLNSLDEVNGRAGC
jgi:hypothetical protein